MGRQSLRKPDSAVAKFTDGGIFCSDAAELLGTLRPQSVDVIFLDPPFNLGKRYGRRSADADRVESHEYAAYLGLVLARAVTALKPGGSLFLYHLPRWAVQFAEALSKRLEFRHWIAIAMKNGFVRANRLYPAHYA